MVQNLIDYTVITIHIILKTEGFDENILAALMIFLNFPLKTSFNGHEIDTNLISEIEIQLQRSDIPNCLESCYINQRIFQEFN